MIKEPPDLTWVVPLYRTGRQAQELSRRCAEVSRGMGLQHVLLFVDDCCPEQGYRDVEALQANHPEIRLLRLTTNHGQDGAIREALRTTKGPIVILDGDLQDPPEAVPLLWAKLKEGYDAVFADRTGRYESRLRLASSFAYRRIMERIGHLPRGAGLYVMLNEHTAAALAATTTTPIYLLAALAGTHGQFTSVPVQRAAREQGVSAYTSWRRLRKGLGSTLQTLKARHLGVKL